MGQAPSRGAKSMGAGEAGDQRTHRRGSEEDTQALGAGALENLDRRRAERIIGERPEGDGVRLKPPRGSLGSLLLTFLAGAEVDPRVMRGRLKESVLIGSLSFAAPFFGAWLVCVWVLGWPTPAAQIAGVALSTTSLAVVYAVLVETGLTLTPLGKLIMASTFVTDFGTALALALLFVRPTSWLVPFLGVSMLGIWAMIALQPWFFSRYGERVIEPEIKGAVAALLVLMLFAVKAQSHAVLARFVLGLALAHIFHAYPDLTRGFPVAAFALLAPFFFLKGGMNVSLKLVWANFGLLLLLFAVKQVTKIAGVYPLAEGREAVNPMFTNL